MTDARQPLRRGVRVRPTRSTTPRRARERRRPTSATSWASRRSSWTTAGTEDEAIAGLLHDAAEDQGGRERLEDIRGRFGDAVARIVEDCTDSWDTPKAPWAERKRAYVEHARRLPPSSLRVSAADKVHNAYAILRDLRNIGEKVWERFNAPADDVVAYYEGLVRAYREAGGGRLVDELDRIVRGIRREMGY